MPILKVTPLYHERKRRFGPELIQARDALAEFKKSLITRFDTETAAAIQKQTRWTTETISGRVGLSGESESAVTTLKELVRKVSTVRKKIHTPDCWFREPPSPVTVLETVGLTSDQVRERCEANGRLPVVEVQWLLNVLRTTLQVLPNDELVWEWAAYRFEPQHLPEEFRGVLRRRKGCWCGYCKRGRC